LFGWSEEKLYRLAQPRPAGAHLWQALRQLRAAEPETLAILDDLLSQAEFLRPFELLQRLLIRHRGRSRLLARLGPETADGIDALLSQARRYEREQVADLTGFLDWFDAETVEMKRQLDTAGDQIRLMTVHGAKGLEAPVVILPDCALRQPQTGQVLIEQPWPPFLSPRKSDAEPVLTERLDDLRRAEAEEDQRLLYVAMTRAQSWLIVAAAGEVTDKSGRTCWHSAVADGLIHSGALADPTEGEGILRLADPGWDSLPPAGAGAPPPAPPQVETRHDEPLPALPASVAVLSPSGLGGAKVLPGEREPDQGDEALLAGSFLHLVLQHLLSVPPADRAALAARLPEAIDPADRPTGAVALADQALAILQRPELAALFSPGTRSEISLTARLADLGGRTVKGTVDLIRIGQDSIEITDFKTNRLVPNRPDQVPEGVLRQMGAYLALARAIWPDRQARCAILWTAAPVLMPLPDDLCMAALRRAGVDLTHPQP
jgi:ATP-dependent helicase/nuclease subunit A